MTTQKTACGSPVRPGVECVQAPERGNNHLAFRLPALDMKHNGSPLATALCSGVVPNEKAGKPPEPSGPDKEVVAMATASLLVCVEAGQVPGVRTALERGADVHAKNGKGLNAFELAHGPDVFDSFPVPRHPEVLAVLRDFVRTHPSPLRGTDMML